VNLFGPNISYTELITNKTFAFIYAMFWPLVLIFFIEDARCRVDVRDGGIMMFTTLCTMRVSCVSIPI